MKNWIIGKRPGSVIEKATAAQIEEAGGGVGQESLDYYGGRLIAESIAPENAALIAELVAVLHGCNEWFTLHHSTANIRKPGGRPTPAVMTIQDALNK